MTAGPAPSRVNVLAYPPPTTSRFLVFIAALLTAGAFIGGWLHNELRGDQWLRTVARCAEAGQRVRPAAADVRGAIERNAAEERCRASADRQRAAFSLGGAVATGAAGLLVLLLAPRVLERRRRMRSLPPALADAAQHVAALAREFAPQRVPTLMLGPASQRDAFTYGTPRRYRIALPPAVAVRWRDPRLFDPLVRHELAHLAHHDVPLAWLARSVWYVLAPLLLLPLVVGVTSGDASLLPGYLWRAALLAVAVLLTSNALLRSREQDADLRAGQCPAGPDSVAALVARSRASEVRPWWRRALAKHPSAERRLAVIARPALVARVTFGDGFATGFLAGLSAPLVIAAVVTLLTGSGHTDAGRVVAAWLAGPLLAGSVGLGLCRTALAYRGSSTAPSPAPAALGVGVGLVVGQAASLAQTGIGTASLGPAAWLPVVALLGIGSTLLAAGVAELLADAAPMFRRSRTSWLVALVVMTLLFTAAVWIAWALETPLQLGWAGTRAWLVTLVSSRLVLAALAIVAAAAAWGLWASRSPRIGPRWLREQGAPAPWPAGRRGDLVRALAIGVAIGLLFAGALAVLRAFWGPAASDASRAERFYLYVWMAGGATFTAALALALGRPRRGVGAAALSGTVACLATTTGFLALNFALGSEWSVAFVTGVARRPLGLAFLAIVLAAFAALLPTPGSLGRWAAVGVLGAACAVVLVTQKPALVPPADLAAGGRTPTAEALEIQVYATAIAPGLITEMSLLEERVAKIDADRVADGPARARRIRREVLPDYRAALQEALAYRPRARAVKEAHDTGVATLRTGVEAFELFAAAFQSLDTDTLTRAQALRQRQARERSRWIAQVAALTASP
jgi:hypothetical protein